MWSYIICVWENELFLGVGREKERKKNREKKRKNLGELRNKKKKLGRENWGS